MEKEAVKTEKTAHAKSHREPRNFLATFLLTLSLGQMGANRLYTGDMTLGWIRFGLFAAGTLLSPVMVGLPLLFAAHIWGWVDVFLVYHGTRTDANGVAFTQTTLDRKVAKILYILFIVSLVLGALALTILLIIAILFGLNHPQFMQSSDEPGRYFYDGRSY